MEKIEIQLKDVNDLNHLLMDDSDRNGIDTRVVKVDNATVTLYQYNGKVYIGIGGDIEASFDLLLVIVDQTLIVNYDNETNHDIENYIREIFTNETVEMAR